MGSFLDKPIVEVEMESGEGLGVTAGLASLQGWRVTQEDAHSLIFGLSEDKGMDDLCWFGVYDGHGGNLVSGKVAELLPKRLASSPPLCKSPEDRSEATLTRTIERAFVDLDEELRGIAAQHSDHSGSTAITVMLSKDKIICANTGDSRAILIRNGKAVALSTDHKPSDASERDRILAAGGHVAFGRVGGDLAVSRAFGDFMYKTAADLEPHQQQVTVVPEFTVRDRGAAEDQYIVLACDGVWDVLTNEDLAAFVMDCVDQGARHPQDLAAAIIRTALISGSRDNISAIVVALPGAPGPVDAEKAERWATRARSLQEAAEAEGAERDESGGGGGGASIPATGASAISEAKGGAPDGGPAAGGGSS